MPNTIYFLNEFQDRKELESAVLRNYPLDTMPKNAEIKGTLADLKRLRLSEKTTFWGISCFATDKKESPPPKVFERLNRGEVKKFGINLNN